MRHWGQNLFFMCAERGVALKPGCALGAQGGQACLAQAAAPQLACHWDRDTVDSIICHWGLRSSGVLATTLRPGVPGIRRLAGACRLAGEAGRAVREASRDHAAPAAAHLAHSRIVVQGLGCRLVSHGLGLGIAHPNRPRCIWLQRRFAWVVSSAPWVCLHHKVLQRSPREGGFLLQRCSHLFNII